MKITISTKIDDDVLKTYKIFNTGERQFELDILIYLNSPDGWSQYGYYFEATQKDPQVLIRLSSSSTIKTDCGLPSNLSCAVLGGSKIWLNSNRWFHGSSKSKLSLEDYRQYMVSHEMGHILGYEHEECKGKGHKAPVMMQQTLGIKKCIPNINVKE
jgi:hypothetical protein